MLDTNYDLCIVGAGPAGIIVALEFCKLNPTKKVCLVEFGTNNKLEKNSLDETIHIKNIVNHHPPYECTNKGLGGTSATWGGRCVMYDEIDFVDRPVLEGGCTWNLNILEEVRPYLSCAAEYFECGRPVFDLNDLPLLKDKRIAENFEEGNVTDSKLERWSMPTRFGKKYKSQIEKCCNLKMYVGYEARSFSVVNTDGVVTSIFVRKSGSTNLQEIKATLFVLSAGAQETTRLLLRNKQIFNTLASPPAALGKYYQGHLSGKIASVKFRGDPKKTEYSFLRDSDGSYIRRRFQFANQFLKDQNLLNTAIWLDNPLYYNPKHKSGAMSFMYLAMLAPIIGKKLAPPAIAQSITKGKIYAIPSHIVNIIKGFPKSIFVPAITFYKRYLLERKLPGVFLYSPKNTYALHFHSEQIPVASNNMEIDADGETLVINYSLTDNDVNSVIKLHDELDKFLQSKGCGELEYWFRREELPEAIRAMSRDGIHQSGTTRISATSEQGVVDANLKVWGTKNIYVVSSSVFPTSSQANPTFLLGAFAARLANHLTKIL
jgi:choline dehydrogenase-like flavoprotein